MILFMIRHGQTTANLDGIYSGQSDVKLTALGQQQAEAIAPILSRYHFDRVYSSDLSRAMDTARFAIPGCEPAPLPLLREFSLGKLTGLYIAEVHDRYGNLNSDFSSFGGETREMVTQRAADFLRILENDPCEYVAAFSHNGLMKGVLRHILGENTDTMAFVNGNCNIAVFRYDGKRWKLLIWNLNGSF